MWKTDGIRNLSAVFSAEKSVFAKDEIPTAKRYAQIGQLTLENDFLKKKSGLVPIRERVKIVDIKNKLSIVKQCRLLEIHRGGLYCKAKQESLENLKIMQLLDQQYFNTSFYGCRKLTL